GHQIPPAAGAAADDEKARGHLPHDPPAQTVVLVGVGAVGERPDRSFLQGAHRRARPPFVSDHVLPVSTSMSWGRPRMRSAMMLRSTCDVPPPTVRAGLKRKPVTHSSHSGSTLSLASIPLAPSRSLASPNTR